MKTLNEKVAETVKSNNATMGNVEELTKVLKQEEKESSNPQLSSSASFLRLNVLSSLN